MLQCYAGVNLYGRRSPSEGCEQNENVLPASCITQDHVLIDPATKKEVGQFKWPAAVQSPEGQQPRRKTPSTSKKPLLKASSQVLTLASNPGMWVQVPAASETAAEAIDEGRCQHQRLRADGS